MQRRFVLIQAVVQTLLGLTLLSSIWAALIDYRSLRYTFAHILLTLFSATLAFKDFKSPKFKTLFLFSITTTLILVGWYYAFWFWPFKGGPFGRFEWEWRTALLSILTLLFSMPTTIYNNYRRTWPA